MRKKKATQNEKNRLIGKKTKKKTEINRKEKKERQILFIRKNELAQKEGKKERNRVI